MTIKRSPSDFQVEEVLTPALQERIQSQPSAFALYRMSKRSLTTPDAVAQIAKRLGTGVGTLAYAGLKDKHAATVQHISVRSTGGGAHQPQRAHGGTWELERIGWVDQEITAQAIEGNRFVVMVRGLTRRAGEQMEEAAALLAIGRDDKSRKPSILRIVNYFGDQRFGSARHGQGFLAKHLIAGDFETALKLSIATASRKERRAQNDFKRMVAANWGQWSQILPKLPWCPERAVVEHLAGSLADFRDAFAVLPYFSQQIAVEAYQSHLWNRIGRRHVEERCSEPAEMIEADDPFGSMLFPSAANIPQDLAELELPLPGRKTELREPWKNCAERVLAEEGIELRELRIPGLKRPYFGEAARRLFVEVRDFAIGNPRKDELDSKAERFRRRIIMMLPRGAYATVVLRALGQ